MRGPRTWTWLVVLAGLVPWGCYYKLEGDYDPFRCDPECSGLCYQGGCVSFDGGVRDDLLSDNGNKDRLAEGATDYTLSDRSFPDGPHDGAGLDGPVLDQPQSADQQPQPDVSLPCQGLTCPLGCNVAAKRCYRLMPTGFDVAPFYDQLTAAVAASGDLTFDTTTGEVRVGTTVLRPPGLPGQVQNGIYWGTLSQAAGYPEVAVFGLKSLDVPSGINGAVVGGRAIALYVAGNLTIAGELSADGKGQIGGPGGYNGGAANGDSGAACFGGEGKGGAEGGSGGSQMESGGGGGGRKANGGKGGDSTYWPYPAGGAGGSPVSGTATLWPLFGGCGGGAGGGPDTGYSSNGNGGGGGGGGGALHLVANGTLSVTGLLLASGAGGDGGHYGAAGGGGGAGGVILLEAAEITITGTLAANGGGGGAGCEDFYEADAPDGQDGLPSPQPALGGPPSPTYGGAGGSGGASSPENGSPGANNVNAGGGGGSAGLVRLNAPKLTANAAKAISPTASTNSAISTW